MSLTPSLAPDEAGDEQSPGGADRVDAAGWLLLGAAALAGSVGMDRLENQDVPAYTAPGLLPGLLGILLLALGAVLMVRSVRRGVGAGVRAGGLLVGALGPAPGRALLVMGLCVLFGAVLVGRGLPFWGAASLFVTAAILLLRLGPEGGRRAVDARGVLSAASIGLATGAAVTAVFQQIFLVRLP